MELPTPQRDQAIEALRRSKSQLDKTSLPLSELNFKTNGYFVDSGATNGVNLSNSFLLEKEFGWSGIVAEPARRWHKDLKKNRAARLKRIACGASQTLP